MIKLGLPFFWGREGGRREEKNPNKHTHEEPKNLRVN